MMRSASLLTLVTLTLVILGVVAPSTPAQFTPGRPGLPVGGFTSGLYSNNPYLGGLNSYNFGYNYSFGFNYVNPITGGRTVFQIDRSYAGPGPYGLGSVPNPLFNSLGYNIPQYRAGYVNPYLSGRQGYSSTGVNPIAAEQARLAQRGANANQAAKPAAPARAPARNVKPEPALEVARAEPEAIRSGEAINRLIPPINDRLDAGNRVEAPLIPAELIRTIRYTPGPKADLLRLLRNGMPVAPELFAESAFLELKNALQKASEPLAKAVLAGKPTNTQESLDLGKQVEVARPRVKELTADRTPEEQAEGLAYLDGLAALAKVDSTPELRGLYNTSFADVGARATDYARHLQKHKLALAPAPPSEVSAYDALYRALATTRAALDRAAE